MPPFRESISAVHSALRTLLAVVVVGMVAAAGWFAYSLYHAPQKALQEKQDQLDTARKELASKEQIISKQQTAIASLNDDLAEKLERIGKLETAMRFLKIDHRLAELRVVRVEDNPDSEHVISTVEFVEVNDEGAAIDEPRQFEFEGDLVYVECLVAKFEDTYVEDADPIRSTSICLFQKIFGEFQEPSEGAELDHVGARPTAYSRGGRMSDFEREIWNDFWNIANDRKRAKEFGIRAAHIEAPAIKVRPGKTYRLLLRASGGLTITPMDTGSRTDAPDA